jgi:hypothetical protein
MPILPKGTSAITKRFPKAASDHMNMFLDAVGLTIYHQTISSGFHITFILLIVAFRSLFLTGLATLQYKLFRPIGIELEYASGFQ